MAARETSMVVRNSRPSGACDLTDHDAPILLEEGASLADSLTLQAAGIYTF
jgi:hypothetical protein